MKNNLIVLVVVAVIVGAGAFFAGMKYQQTKSPTSRFGNIQAGQARFGGQNGQGRFGGGGRPVVGEIINTDDKSITVKLADGSSKIVLLPDNAVISKTDTGSKTDLKTGINVGVFGTENSDGSVTAQNVQLNPMFRNATVSGAPR